MVRTAPPRTTSRICRSRSISTPLPLIVAFGPDAGLERLERLRPDDAVALEARGLLERPDGLLGQRPERAVGGAEPVAELLEPLLQGEHLGAGVAADQAGARLRRGGGLAGSGFVVGVGDGVGRRASPTASAWGSCVGVARRRRRGGRRTAGVHSAEPWWRGRTGGRRGGHRPRSTTPLERPAAGEQHRRSRQRGSGGHRARAPASDPSVLLRPVLRLHPPGPPADGIRAGRRQLDAPVVTDSLPGEPTRRRQPRFRIASSVAITLRAISTWRFSTILPRWVTTPAPAPASQAARISRASSTSSRRRREDRVARLDLPGVDQGLAVEAQVAALPALRLEPVEVHDVVVDAVEDRDARPSGGEQRQRQRGQQRLAPGHVAGAELLDEVVGAHDEHGEPR